MRQRQKNFEEGECVKKAGVADTDTHLPGTEQLTHTHALHVPSHRLRVSYVLA